MRRILVVEDEPDIRESLVDFFEGRGCAVTAAADTATARERLDDAAFDAILLDLQLPDGDGLTVLRELRDSGNDTPVVVVTARGEEQQRIQGLELGADDYVLKPFSVAELAARIEAVWRRCGEPQNDTIELPHAIVDLAALEVRHRGGTSHRLLQKEAALIRFFITHPDRVFSRDQLLSEVWGYDSYPSTRTVDTHVFQLRKKIEADPTQPAHLLTAHGVGYRWTV